jgi:pyridoxine 5-phosphate synthase
MTRLGVNVDHVATVRQARRAAEPDPVAAAVLAILGGADGITIHLREDRRHIQDRDVDRMREAVTHARLNLEMATAEDIVRIAERVRPDEATLVPEKRQELTTEGGLDLLAHRDAVRATTDRLKAAGVVVSLFIDPDPAQLDAAKALGADAIEFQTGSYSEATGPAVATELDRLRAAAAHAVGLGLHVHAGHGLNYHNVRPVATIPGMEGLNIGHSIVSRAVLVGMTQAVRDMRQAMGG